MAQAYLGLGANLGDRAGTLRAALADLNAIGRITRRSSLYETEPVGYLDQPLFLNAVVLLETELAPEALLRHTSAIERTHGRRRSFANAPRTIDIDILFYDDQIIERTDLAIPHPRLAERAFVLVPLAEIAPELLHPRLHLRARELLERLSPDHEQVRRFIGPDWVTTADPTAAEELQE